MFTDKVVHFVSVYTPFPGIAAKTNSLTSYWCVSINLTRNLGYLRSQNYSLVLFSYADGTNEGRRRTFEKRPSLGNQISYPAEGTAFIKDSMAQAIKTYGPFLTPRTGVKKVVSKNEPPKKPEMTSVPVHSCLGLLARVSLGLGVAPLCWGFGYCIMPLCLGLGYCIMQGKV